MSTETAIGEGSGVTLNFAIRLDNGDTVDSTFERKPAAFTMGDGSLLPGFEQVLVGLKAGDRQSFVLEPAQAFGPSNPNNMQTLPRSQFAEMELEPGLMVMFRDAANGELPGVIAAFDAEQVTVDFNHPLAGKTLTFEVEIISVESV